MLKAAKEKFVVFESIPVPDYKIQAWIETYCRSKKIAIQPLAASMLSEFLGNDLSQIVNEIENNGDLNAEGLSQAAEKLCSLLRSKAKIGRLTEDEMRLLRIAFAGMSAKKNIAGKAEVA